MAAAFIYGSDSERYRDMVSEDTQEYMLGWSKNTCLAGQNEWLKNVTKVYN